MGNVCTATVSLSYIINTTKFRPPEFVGGSGKNSTKWVTSTTDDNAYFLNVIVGIRAFFVSAETNGRKR